MNFLKKGATSAPLPPPPSPLPPPHGGADHGRKIKLAGLLRQQFEEKIQNGGQRFTLDLLECLV